MKHKIITALFILCIIALFVFLYQDKSFFYLLATLIILYLTITALGSYQIKWNYFIKSVNEGKPEGISLTFDDGPEPKVTKKILDVLELAGVKATFFVIGKKAEQYPDIINLIVGKGHTIGNHSWSHHAGIGMFSKQKLLADFNQCSQKIEEITGQKTVYLRPPFGVTNPRYENVLKNTGMKSIGWSIRSFDTSAKNEQKLLHRITSQLKPGAIVLLHDTKDITLDILPALLNYCKQNNIAIKPLAELIET